MKEHSKIFYNDNDVILTTEDEYFFYHELKKFGFKVKRKATKKESIEYQKEYDYWQKDESDNQHIGSYHELPE